MLSTRNRFNRRNHVNYVHRKGKSVRGSQVSLRYVRGQDHADYRAAVVVSKKVDKRAVVRNRIRRRIYEYIRTLEPPIQSDVDVVVTVFDSTLANIPSEALRERLDEIIRKAGLQSDPPGH